MSLTVVELYSIGLVSLAGFYALFKVITTSQGKHIVQSAVRLASPVVKPVVGSASFILQNAARTVLFIVRRLLYSPVPLTSSITGFEGLCICLIVGGNVVALSVSVHDRLDLDKRAANLAAINATLLFLGGRTNPWANLLGISLSRYYLFHRWIGLAVILEGLLHSVLSISRSQSFARTALVRNVEASGYVNTVAYSLILITSICSIRRFLSWWFRWLHMALSTASLASLIWHVLVRQDVVLRIPSVLAASLWISSRVWISLQIYFSAVGASVGNVESFQGVTKIQLYCNRAVRIFPGSYFYIFPAGKTIDYNYFNSNRMMLAWYASDTLQRARTVELLISAHPRGQWFAEQKCLLDGPYGHDLAFQRFDKVVLAAKGIGISGILPFALGLIERAENNMQDSTQTIFILWRVENGNQVAWVVPQLKRLRKRDNKGLITFWALSPFESIHPSFWRKKRLWDWFDPTSGPVSEYRYLNSMIDLVLPDKDEDKDTDTDQGQTVLAACGDKKFITTCREVTVRRMKPSKPIRFVEVDYRPPRHRTSVSSTMAEEGRAEKHTDGDEFEPAVNGKKRKVV